MSKSDKSRTSPRSRRRGWIIIAAVALFTLLFFVLGTIDSDLRYDLIGL